MTKKPNKEFVYLSPSSVQRWFEVGCPARWKLEKEWEPKERNEFAERGILVHSMLEGTVDPASVTDKTAQMFYSKILDADRLSGLQTVEAELRQEFPLFEDVMWVRRIDRLARTAEGRPVLVDYKTTGALWKSLSDGETVPQALASQSPGYLIPPPPDMYQGEWPTSIFYLVAGFRGPASFFRYDQSEEDLANFLTMVRMIRDAVRAEAYPKVRGKACLECPMNAACYQLPGWRKQYVKRKR